MTSGFVVRSFKKRYRWQGCSRCRPFARSCCWSHGVYFPGCDTDSRADTGFDSKDYRDRGCAHGLWQLDAVPNGYLYRGRIRSDGSRRSRRVINWASRTWISGDLCRLRPWILTFALAAVRVGTLFVIAPLFSMRTIPTVIKLGAVASISLIVMSTIQPRLELMQLGAWEVAGAVLTEAVVGGVMGFAVMILFAAIAFTGQLIGVQMGFAIANVVDPSTQQQSGILSQVLNIFALALFLATDGHLYLPCPLSEL